jgi:lipopolysaccharide export system permease protein
MRTIRRLLHLEVGLAVAFVAFGFTALFSFFDFSSDLDRIGKNGYTLMDQLLVVALWVPSHLYELMPIAVLIGAIFVMARMAQSSEFTILRTSGLGPVRALKSLASLGLAFSALTYVLGDFVVPPAESAAQLLKAKATGGLSVGQTGIWLRDRTDRGSFAVNVRGVDAKGELQGIKLFEFDVDGQLVGRISASRARPGEDGWTLMNGVREALPRGRVGTQIDAAASAAQQTPAMQRQAFESMDWPNSLSASVVTVAVANPERMSAISLYRYMTHLEDNEQAAQRYEIQFWKKVIYPFACLVMIMLALPFAYLHFRSGGISLQVFGGIMVGVSFVLMGHVSSHVGLLRDWTPVLAAALPSAFYLAVSLGVFSWLVKNR